MCLSSTAYLMKLIGMHLYIYLQEARVERDIFASEVRRLQKELRKLHHLHHRIISGNAEVARLRALIHGFNLHGQQLSQTISVSVLFFIIIIKLLLLSASVVSNSEKVLPLGYHLYTT